MEIKQAKCGAMVINDCYNANYDSMKAALDYMSKLPNPRKIAVLGDMGELGEYSQEIHEKIGEVVAQDNIDILICVGTEVKSLINKAKENGIENTYICNSNEEAIKLLNERLQKDDVVLIKASNYMKFTEICEAIC